MQKTALYHSVLTLKSFEEAEIPSKRLIVKINLHWIFRVLYSFAIFFSYLKSLPKKEVSMFALDNRTNNVKSEPMIHSVFPKLLLQHR